MSREFHLSHSLKNSTREVSTQHYRISDYLCIQVIKKKIHTAAIGRLRKIKSLTNMQYYLDRI